VVTSLLGLVIVSHLSPKGSGCFTRRLSGIEIEAMLNNLKENESGDGYIGFGTKHN
jgi:hypothetical protein